MNLFSKYFGNVIIPTDSYFSEGLKPPTSNYTGMIGNNSGTITADLISEQHGIPNADFDTDRFIQGWVKLPLKLHEITMFGMFVEYTSMKLARVPFGSGGFDAQPNIKLVPSFPCSPVSNPNVEIPMISLLTLPHYISLKPTVKTMFNWLVVWYILYFLHSVGNVIIPTDELHHFF